MIIFALRGNTPAFCRNYFANSPGLIYASSTFVIRWEAGVMRMHAIFRAALILALLALAVGAVWAQGTPGADAQYFSWVRGCVGDFNADLPAITASAEVAAGHFVHDNWDFGAWGEGSFVSEFTGRAGGP